MDTHVLVRQLNDHKWQYARGLLTTDISEIIVQENENWTFKLVRDIDGSLIKYTIRNKDGYIFKNCYN